MIRFIHTADIHLDAPLVNLSALYEIRQDDYRQTLKRMRDIVWDKQVDFWLIAGDLLEYHGGSLLSAHFLIELFHSVAPIPVLISPGNHDPWMEGSFYQTLDWPSNVHIFTGEWGIIDFPQKSCVIYGWGFTQAHIHDNPLAQFPGKLNEYRHHLMLIHGSVITGEEMDHSPYAPMTVGSLAQTEVNYVALGHIHKAMTFTHPRSGKIFAAYPGSPEGLSSKETGERHVILGTLDEKNELTLETIPVHSRQIRKVTITLAGLESIDQMMSHVEEVLRHEDKENLLYVTIEGERTAHLAVPISLMQSRFKEFFFIRFQDDTYPDIDQEQIKRSGGVWNKWLTQMEKLEEQCSDDREKQVLLLAKKEVLKRIGGALR
ncbi:metallophosphoesterase family protein [Brevibacillus daliensis]|uniref:metallophosphoesterase family protein n=1 Tax=Brevibacillus daliensis TaxID=2892995 RepID=UPI001E40DC83|nr:DNA repair exonuclease [Brevibacillus daliensis]